MFEVRFLKDASRVAEVEASSLKDARNRADAGFDHADQAVIVKRKEQQRPEYVEVRNLAIDPLEPST